MCEGATLQCVRGPLFSVVLVHYTHLSVPAYCKNNGARYPLAGGRQCVVQCNLSNTATSGPLWRGGCSTEVDCNVLVLFGAREAGCFREVAA